MVHGQVLANSLVHNRPQANCIDASTKQAGSIAIGGYGDVFFLETRAGVVLVDGASVTPPWSRGK